jgi:hypothetical protein
VILSVGVGNEDLSSDFVAAYKAANLRIYSLEEFTSFFAGLDLVPPGVVPAQGWTGDDEPLALESRSASFLVGVGRKTR